MAHEQAVPQPRAPWKKIFDSFRVALDLKKLLLAAAGILLVSFGWWAIGGAFYGLVSCPQWRDVDSKNIQGKDREALWTTFKARRKSWNLLHSLAGNPSARIPVDAADLATNLDEFVLLEDWEEAQGKGSLDLAKADKENHQLFLTFEQNRLLPRIKPAGKFRALVFSEYRGENPYLLVTEHIKTAGRQGASHLPSAGWILDEQIPVLLEPLYKFLAPLVYLFNKDAGVWERLYLVVLTLWTLAVWSFFGGAICRIAAVQIARNERITLMEALNFMRERYVSFLLAPLIPLGVIAVLLLILVIFGWFTWVPILGEIVAGLLWPIVLLIGLIIAVVLVGLVGWPLMNATISTEGSDSFDALSRSYSYVYGAPWKYLWYNLLAIAYGAVLVFFVGFMASLLVFVGEWGVSSAPGLAKSDPASDRAPSYLFLWAPTSLGWRDLLISNSQFAEPKQTLTPSGLAVTHYEFQKDYEATIHSYNYIGIALVTVWIWAIFLLVVGFGYSYFWSASTIVYFLMRHSVDDTDMDEVYLDDDGLEDPFLKPTPPPAPATHTPSSPKPGVLSLNVIESPPPPPMPPPPEAPAMPPPTAISPTSPPPPPPPAGDGMGPH